MQASLKLSKMQTEQLAVQGRRNAAALALQQERCAGIVSVLQVHRYSGVHEHQQHELFQKSAKPCPALISTRHCSTVAC